MTRYNGRHEDTARCDDCERDTPIDDLCLFNNDWICPDCYEKHTVEDESDWDDDEDHIFGGDRVDDFDD